MPEDSFWERFNEGKIDRRTFVKVASLLGGAAVFGLPLVGCQPAAAPPKQVFEMKLAVPQPMLQVTPVYSGDAKNIFVEAGVKNVATQFSGGADQVRAILTGGYPLGVTSPTAAMAALEKGQPARLVAGGFNASGVGFLTRADSPFKKAEDLKSRKFKIAYSRPTSNSHIVAYLGLKALGIDPEDKARVEFVATGGNAATWTAIESGIVDVGWSTEPIITKVEKEGKGRLLWMTWDLVKNWVDVGIMTKQPFLDSNAEQMKAWVGAYVKSVDWVKNNYGEAAKILAQTLGIEESLAQAAFKKVPKDIWSASIPISGLEVMAKAMVQFKKLKAMPDWKVLVNDSFLPANLRNA
jgi:ABC-type nitrate/sulfonate/bicarbonate transport system substrate-binding protein